MQGLVPPISTGHLPHQQQGQERFMASSELLSQLRRKFETCGSPMDQVSGPRC